MPATTRNLQGLSILVVEDMLLVADIITAHLEDEGCRIIGPVGRLQQGLALAISESFDGAFLDINLAGEKSFPIADVLEKRGIPFVFLTGYGEEHVADKYIGVLRVAKPFALNALVQAAATFLG